MFFWKFLKASVPVFGVLLWWLLFSSFCAITVPEVNSWPKFSQHVPVLQVLFWVFITILILITKQTMFDMCVIFESADQTASIVELVDYTASLLQPKSQGNPACMLIVEYHCNVVTNQQIVCTNQ